MKTLESIKHIAFVCAQQGILTMFGTIIAAGLVFAGTVTTLAKPENLHQPGHLPWNMFLVALLIVSIIISIYLKKLVFCNQCPVIPNFFRNQLLFVGVAGSIFILWPTLLTAFFRFSPLITLALFLFTASLVLWAQFEWEGAGPPLVIISLRLLYELLGLNTDIHIFGSVSSVTLFRSKTPIALITITISIMLLYLFFRRFLALSRQESQKENGFKRDSLSRHYDIIPNSIRRISRRELSLLANRAKKEKQIPSILRFSQMLRVGLFSPRYVFLSPFSLDFVPIFAFWMYINITLSSSTDPRRVINMIIVFLFLIYFGGVLLLTHDFLLHRGNLPSLWFQAPFNSKQDFAKVLILSYLSVGLKQYLLISLIYMLVLVLFPHITLFHLLPMNLFGLCFFVLAISLSLLSTDAVTSDNATEWIIGLVILLVFSVIIIAVGIRKLPGNFDLSDHIVWAFLGVSALISLLVLRQAYHKWSSVELNYSSPESIR